MGLVGVIHLFAEAMIYLLVIVVVAGAIFVAYSSNIQATTKWLGQRIEEKKMIRTTPHSFSSALEIQTMISSPWNIARNFGGLVLYVVVVAIGLLIKWWVAVAALVALIVISSVVSIAFLPRKLSYWIKCVSIGVQNRISDYRRKNDFDRATGLSHFLPILAEYEQLADSQALDIAKIK